MLFPRGTKSQDYYPSRLQLLIKDFLLHPLFWEAVDVMKVFWVFGGFDIDFG